MEGRPYSRQFPRWVHVLQVKCIYYLKALEDSKWEDGVEVCQLQETSVGLGRSRKGWRLNSMVGGWRGRGLEFSCWRYLRVTRSEFLKDLVYRYKSI